MTPELIADTARRITIEQLISMMENCRSNGLPYWAVLDQLRAMLKHKDGQP